MKQITLTKTYLIYFATCIAIIILYLYSTILKEDAEMVGQSHSFISQYYNLGTVAMIGFGLNLSYFCHLRKTNKILGIIHLVLATLLFLLSV